MNEQHWHHALQGWRNHLAAGGRAPGTIKLRISHIHAAARALETRLEDVDAPALEHYLARPGWSPSTRRSHRSSLRLFFAWAAATGHIDADPAAALPSVIQPRALPRPATEEATDAALRTTDERTRLMVGLMALAGLRRDEVARVRGAELLDGVDVTRLRIVGKGGHVRVVPIPGHLAAAIRRRGTGWTFPGQIDGHLSARRVGELVGGVLPPGVTAHALRHRFATVVYARSRDIRAVQTLLGHAKLDTTMVYVGVSDASTTTAAATAWSTAA